MLDRYDVQRFEARGSVNALQQLALDFGQAADYW